MKALETGVPAFRADRYATHLLHDDPNVRVLAFGLKPGQEVPAHSSRATVMLHVVEGSGVFRGDDGEARLAPGEAVVYAPGETHSIVAGEAPLRFLAILTPSPR